MFKYDKKYNGLLNIGEKYVSIDTRHKYQMIEIKYLDVMKIYSSLPKDYVIKKGRSAIVIIKKTQNDKILDNLFRYLGFAKIISCKIFTSDGTEYMLPINKMALQTYEAFDKVLVQSGDDVLQTWQGLTRNWEDLLFNGNNNQRVYLYNYVKVDKEAKTTELITETRSGLTERKSYG